MSNSAEPKVAMVAGHLTERMAAELKALAERNERTTSAEVRIAVRRHLAEARVGLLSEA